MSTIKSFEDLVIWKKSKDFDKLLYANIEKSALILSDFRFKSQILSASGSIMDNIAEGFERDSNKEFILFLSYSKGSTEEVRSQLHRALHRGYLDNEIGENLINEIIKISQKIHSLIVYLKSSELRGRKHK